MSASVTVGEESRYDVDDSERCDSRRSRDVNSWVTAFVYASSVLVKTVSLVCIDAHHARRTYDANPDLYTPLLTSLYTQSFIPSMSLRSFSGNKSTFLYLSSTRSSNAP
jgi:hypothetical protein